MKINFFFRHPQVGFSIQRVFQTINLGVSEVFDTSELFLPSPLSNIRSILKNGLFAKKNQGDINHVTGDAHYLLYFLDKKKTVVTVHDIMYYSYLSGIKKKIWKLLYIKSLKYANRVIFISDFAKEQVLNEIHLPPNKYRVIPNPVSPDFRLHLKEFNTLKPVILHIGGKLERKNLERTIIALNGIECHLRIIGKISDKNLMALHNFKIEYSNAINISNEEMVNEYNKCDIINFPSLFEGFGMPIIEGQAVGKIVITSNIPPMNQVSGNGAVLVNPLEIESIREGYLKILNDEDFRIRTIKNGLENVKKYNLTNITNQYLSVYREMTS